MSVRRAELYEAKLQAQDTKLREIETKNNTAEDLAAQILLLQELQTRTDTEHDQELAGFRQMLERSKAETESLRLQVEQERCSQATSKQEQVRVEQALRAEIQLMNTSMSELEEKFKTQNDQMSALQKRYQESAAELKTSLAANETLTDSIENLNQASILNTNQLNAAYAEINRILEEINGKEEERKYYQEQVNKTIQDVNDALARKSDELDVARSEISRVQEEARSSMQEMLEIRTGELQVKHDHEIARLRDAFDDELQGALKSKDEKITSMQRQHTQDIQTTKADHELELNGLRLQWENQMSDLRRQHEEHAKVVIGKQILAEELERCRDALQKQDREFEQLKRCHENERSTLIESKRTVESALDQAKQDLVKKVESHEKLKEEMAALAMERNALAGEVQDTGGAAQVEALVSQVETLWNDKTAVLQQLADSQTLLQAAKERHAGRAAACVDAVNKAALLKEELMRIQQTLGAEIESIDATHASLYSEVCVCVCVCVCACVCVCVCV